MGGIVLRGRTSKKCITCNIIKYNTGKVPSLYYNNETSILALHRKMLVHKKTTMVQK